MPVGVVEHGPVDERAPVKPLLGVAVEPHPQGSAGKPREHAAHPGKQLAVNHHIEFERPQSAQDPDAVGGKAPHGPVVQRQHVLPGDDSQQVQHFAVPCKQQGADFDARVKALQPGEHRLGQHQAAHLRKQNNEDPSRRVGNLPPGAELVQQGKRGAHGHAHEAIHRPLEPDIHAARNRGAATPAPRRAGAVARGSWPGAIHAGLRRAALV